MVKWGYMQWAKQKGFTIVELLIVVVVIAILAAITIVAYNGIQNRSKQSATQSAVSQASKKIQTFAAANSDALPDDFNALGVPTSSTLNYTYLPYNTAPYRNYCVSATNTTASNLSFAISSNSGGAVSGRCATNLVGNPRLIGLTGFIAAGNGSVSSISGGGITLTQTGADAPAIDVAATVPDAGTYAVRVSGSNLGIRGTWDSDWNSVGRSNENYSGGIRVFTFNASASTGVIRIRVGLPSGSANGSQTTIDQIQVIRSDTTTTEYRDGSSPGWSWNGPTNAARSTGPMPL